MSIVVMSAPASATPEIRGLWVVRTMITKPEDVAKVVQYADSHKYNVLFVQVRGRGDAFYKSNFVPAPELYPEIPDTFDPLGEIIKQAHAKGIEVHAWFNMFLTWSAVSVPSDPNHPFNRHPEWFMVSIDGQSMVDANRETIEAHKTEGRYISPGLEPVRDYLNRVITEVILKYNVDGVHLDYIRYPGRQYDFNSVIRREFNERYGFDPRDMVSGKKEVQPVIENLERWLTFKSEYIDSYVRSLKKKLELVDRKIRLSAAVKPNANEAYYQYGQNWAKWLNEGILDFVVTMSYFKDIEDTRNALTASLLKVDKRKIIGGIGVYLLTPEDAGKQISLMRELGLLGYCVFSYTSLVENPDYTKVFERYISENRADGLPDEFKPYMRSHYE